MTDPDWERFRNVLATVKTEKRSGTLTRERFAELWREAEQALNGHEEFLEALTLFAPSDHD